jgi:hypothetical protein
VVLESATAGKVWLGARTAKAERGKDLVELVLMTMSLILRIG